jgi:hypothetical protein
MGKLGGASWAIVRAIGNSGAATIVPTSVNDNAKVCLFQWDIKIVYLKYRGNTAWDMRALTHKHCH